MNHSMMTAGHTHMRWNEGWKGDLFSRTWYLIFVTNKHLEKEPNWNPCQVPTFARRAVRFVLEVILITNLHLSLSRLSDFISELRACKHYTCNLLLFTKAFRRWQQDPLCWDTFFLNTLQMGSAQSLGRRDHIKCDGVKITQQQHIASECYAFSCTMHAAYLSIRLRVYYVMM